MQTLKNKIVARIYAHGRGCAFSSKDFVGLGDRATDSKVCLLFRSYLAVFRNDMGTHRLGTYCIFASSSLPRLILR